MGAVMDNDLMALTREWAALKKSRAELEDSVDEIKIKLAALEARILDGFSAAGVKRVNLEGFGTVHLNKQIWASAADGDQDRLNAALRSIGQGGAIEERINTQTLSSMVREWLETGGVPEAVAPAIKVSTVYRLGLRSS
jgi:hypothetical protein